MGITPGEASGHISLFTPEELEARRQKQEVGVLRRREEYFGRKDVAELHRQNVEALRFVGNVGPARLKAVLNMSVADAEGLAESATLSGVGVEDFIRDLAGQGERDSNLLRERYREYKNKYGITSLDFDLVHKHLLENEDEPNEKKFRMEAARRAIDSSPKFSNLLKILEYDGKIKDFEHKHVLMVKTRVDVNRILDQLNRNIEAAKGDLGQTRLLNSRRDSLIRRWAQMEEEALAVETKSQGDILLDAAGATLADMAIGLGKGLRWYLPKKLSKDLVRWAEDWRMEYDEMFGADPTLGGFLNPRGLAVEICGGVLPGVLTWSALGSFLVAPGIARFGIATGGFKQAIATGVVDKLFPAGYELFAEEGEGMGAATGEIWEGVKYAGGGYLGLRYLVGAPAKYIAGKSKDVAGLVKTRLMIRSHDNVFDVKAADAASKKFVKLIKDAVGGSDESKIAAKMVLDNLVNEVEHCPKKWNALGKSVQEACDALEGAGIKGVRHPKPSPELLYLEGIKSGADEEVVKKTVAAFGKTVGELDQDLLKQMQELDKIYEKLFDSTYYKQVLEHAKRTELQLGRKGRIDRGISEMVKEGKKVKTEKVKVKKAERKTTKHAKKAAEGIEKGKKMAPGQIKAVLKKAKGLPASEQTEFLRKHGITKEGIEGVKKVPTVKAVLQKQQSDKFYNSLTKVEKGNYNDAFKKGGIALGVKQIVEDRVKNGITKVGLAFKRGKPGLGKLEYEKHLKLLVALKQSDGTLVDRMAGRGAARLRAAYKRLMRKFK